MYGNILAVADGQNVQFVIVFQKLPAQKGIFKIEKYYEIPKVDLVDKKWIVILCNEKIHRILFFVMNHY